MSTLNNSGNVIVCGASGALGTGLKGCLARFKKAKKFLLTSSSYVFDGAVDFTDAYIATLVASGDVIAFDGVSSIEDLSTQNSYTDIGDGVEVLENEGLVKVKIKFIKGMYQHKVLSSYNGNGQYSFAAVDDSGTLIGTTATNGSLKGFTLGIHQTEVIEGIFATNTPSESFIVQFVNTSEFANYYLKQSDDDFNGLNIPSVNEIVLTLTAPAGTDTVVTINAVRKQDGSPFTGAVFGQFLIKTNGATTNPTGGDDSVTAGTYVLTGITALAATDIVSANLYNNTDSRPAIDVSGDYYKSNTSSATVV